MERTTAAAVTTDRGRFQGVGQIVRYNWPYYVSSVVLAVVGWALLAKFTMPGILQTLLLLAVAGICFWTLSSLVVSFYVYDVSSLYRLDWLHDVLAFQPKRWVSFHAGLDETSAVILKLFPGSDGRTYDIYDPRTMKERSIRRARASVGRSLPAAQADASRLPLNSLEIDVAFLMLAVHEVRGLKERIEFFRELHRVLKPEGRIILVEHLRDAWNFVAYGPGFRHFLSRRSWIRVAQEAGLVVLEERSLTPFVRCFVLTREEA